jgi:hypothetical protein
MKPTVEERLINAVYGSANKRKSCALPSKKIGAAFRTIIKNARVVVESSETKKPRYYYEWEDKCKEIYSKFYDAEWEGKLPERADKIKVLDLDGNFLRGMQFAFRSVKDKVDLNEVQIGPLYFHSYGGHIYLFQGTEEDIMARLKKGQQDLRELMRSAKIVNG